MNTPISRQADKAKDKSFYWNRIAGISVALLIPVFWHKRIEAGDLGSHLYNAWLAQLIRQGATPGLWIARQWNNVLFDELLSWLGSAFGLHAAERIAVSLAVLTFFWGSFALIAAATRRLPWNLSPLLAVFAYGWTFEMGFMNYYLSLGLCFLSLALFWRGGPRTRWLALGLLPLAWLAQPLGVAWFIAIAAYVALAKAVSSQQQGYFLAAAGLFLLAMRAFLEKHYLVRSNAFARYFFYNGADQLALYSSRYYWLYALLALFLLAALIHDASGSRRTPSFWDQCGIPLQLYLSVGMASIILPSVIQFPQYAKPVSFLTPRISSVSGVLACWMLGAIVPRRWHTICCVVIAATFFTFLYIDTGALNKIEENAERAVAALPQGARVVNAIYSTDDSRVVIEHIVDRACIGHCFSYENYEPSTGQFRVRAAPGNSIVDAGPWPDGAAKTPAEVANALGPQVYEISRCDEATMNVCVRALSAKEVRELIAGGPDSSSSP